MKKIFFIIALAALVSTCGARKTQKSSSELEASAQDTTHQVSAAGSQVIKTSLGEKTQLANVTWNANTAVLTPTDPTRPMSMTGPDGATTTWNNANVNLGTNAGTKATKTDEKTLVIEAKKDTTATTAAAGHKDNLKAAASAAGSDKKAAVNWTVVFCFAGGFVLLALLLFLLLRYKPWKKKT